MPLYRPVRKKNASSSHGISSVSSALRKFDVRQSAEVLRCSEECIYANDSVWTVIAFRPRRHAALKL